MGQLGHSLELLMIKRQFVLILLLQMPFLNLEQPKKREKRESERLSVGCHVRLRTDHSQLVHNYFQQNDWSYLPLDWILMSQIFSQLHLLISTKYTI